MFEPGDTAGAAFQATPICAIGASAGGVAALQKFFSALENDLGLAYVVIMHLSPDHPSQLSEILAGRTSMPVQQVEDTPRLQPNCVYVIAPDRELVIEGDNVTARPISESRRQRAPIDMFFRSVAQARGDGLAVVLSGAGSDGALGVRAAKEAGGVIFVQDPAEAEFPMMPRSAIATGDVDFVAPIAELVERVAEVVRSKRALRLLKEEDAEQDVRQIIGFLRARTGHDFAHYKRTTVMRRVARRMQVTRQQSLSAYDQYLRSNPEEAQELFADLLISVTMFFRDRSAFDALVEKAIRPLFDRIENDDGIRVWVVGCATGEEAYSIAMLLLEEADRRKIVPTIQIFASDLDEGALATAREGRYPKAIEADVSEERLRRFFVDEGLHYRIRKEVRDRVLFASHSVLKDPPFIRLDLITCRNLLIYLDRELQRQLCTLLHYALNPHGFLYLGSAETIDTTPGLFGVVDREARLYVTKPVADAAPVLPPPLVAEPHRPRAEHGPAARSEPRAGLAGLHATALERRAPPSALVDEGHRVLHLSPTAGQFIQPSEGAFSSELTELVRPELRLDLKLALQRVFAQRGPTLTLPIGVAFDGERRRVLMHVSPTAQDEQSVPHALVLFLDAGPAPSPDAQPPSAEDTRPDEVHRLHQELAVTQERLGASRREHEQAVQELRAANEELQSINEEYRSTAEELETSKEELQSMNEELQTVNAELKGKLENISSAHSDLQNLMAATEIGTLFLDPQLRIKLFTPTIAGYFNITDADLGRAITDFTHRLDHEGVERDAMQVLKNLVPVEKEIRTRDDRWLMMRLRPYRTIEDRIDGIVVTFIDITERKQAEDALAREVRAMSRLQELSLKVVEGGELQASLETVLDATMELIDADFGHIQLYDKTSKTLRIVAQRGFEEHFHDHVAQVNAEEGSSCGMALASREQVAIEDVEQEPAYRPSLEAARAAGYRAVQSTPLLTGDGNPVGMLTLHFRAPRRFSAHDLRLVDICARQAADAIRAFQLRDSLVASEHRLRQVLETDAVAVMFFDRHGTLIDANPAFSEMTGYSQAEVATGELTWHTMTPPEWVDDSDEQLERLEQTGRLGPYEKEYLHKDGSRRWMLFAGRSLDDGTIAEYGIDISDRKRAESERELLARELSHRVKNTLAVVQSLALHSDGGKTQSVDAFRQAFVGRLQAMARAHNLLLDAHWRSADLKQLVLQTTEAYRVEHPDVVTVDGPSVALTPKQSLGLSLALHELCTNAAKYGALSRHRGRLCISWQVEPAEQGGRVRLLWVERHGQKVKPPTEKGFGMQLIELAGTAEVGGAVKLDFAPEGLTCEIVFPLA